MPVYETEVFDEVVMLRSATVIAELLLTYELKPQDIRAHREIAETSCPSNEIYRWLRGNDMNKDGIGDGMKLITQEYLRLKGD